MREIKVNDYRGREFSGQWNERTYSNKIDGSDNLMRIYVDGEEIHITKEEYQRTLGDIKRWERARASEKIRKFFDFAKELDDEQKLNILLKALYMAPEREEIKDQLYKFKRAVEKADKNMERERRGW